MKTSKIENLKIILLIVFTLLLSLRTSIANSLEIVKENTRLETYENYFEEYRSYKVELIIFYSRNCRHCDDELKFIDKIEERYRDNVRFVKYCVEDGGKIIEIWKEMCKIHDIERYFGSVPLTFIRLFGEEKGIYFIGFDTEENTGKKIEEALQNYILMAESKENKERKNQTSLVPFIGNIDNYSLPIASAILGFIDGFNICSLGALIIILSLVIGIKSRKQVIILGGIYILTTSFVYALLMLFWYNLFEIFGNYINKLEILVGIIGIAGSVYFFKEFYRFKKYGPSCESKFGNKILEKFSKKFSEMQKKGMGLMLLLLSVLGFSLVITVVEFPCSAAIPLFYVSVLATKELNFIYELLLMTIYITFYMLDEIIIFLLALFTLRIKFTSAKATSYMYLFAAVILFIWGLSYLIKI